MDTGMAMRGRGRMRVVAESRREPLVPNGVLGMLIFVMTEIMFFAGLISAFTIVKSGAPIWPPPGQPRLPMEETALNTLALLLSGVMLYVAGRRYSRNRTSARAPLLAAMLLGLFFVAFQGVEWVALIAQGLTLTSSTLGSFFFLIVGLHALHAVAALIVLGYAWLRIQRGWLAHRHLAAAEVFWYFVVGIWPVLYLVVYW
jgi:heme/copper-type cytochrome/quinol oxidase subunit 3